MSNNSYREGVSRWCGTPSLLSFNLRRMVEAQSLATSRCIALRTIVAQAFATSRDGDILYLLSSFLSAIATQRVYLQPKYHQSHEAQLYHFSCYLIFIILGHLLPLQHDSHIGKDSYLKGIYIAVAHPHNRYAIPPSGHGSIDMDRLYPCNSITHFLVGIALLFHYIATACHCIKNSAKESIIYLHTPPLARIYTTQMGN